MYFSVGLLYFSGVSSVFISFFCRFLLFNLWNEVYSFVFFKLMFLFFFQFVVFLYVRFRFFFRIRSLLSMLIQFCHLFFFPVLSFF